MTCSLDTILSRIRKHANRELAQKRGWKKKVKGEISQLLRVMGYRLFAEKELRAARTNQRFGTDEFGRDVAVALNEYVALLKRRGLFLRTVLLMGSRAKRKWKPQSDIDVLVIADNLPKERRYSVPFGEILNFKRWMLLSDRPLFIGIEPSGCCSHQEFLRRLDNFDIQALDALYYGKVLYDDGFWKEAKETFTRIKEVCGPISEELKKILLPL
jgi:predicted nucleotidyltransferase